MYTMLTLLRRSDAHAYIYPYMGIVSPYNVLNVKVTAWVRRAYTYSDVHIWLLYTHVTIYTILGLLRGSYTVHVACIYNSRATEIGKKTSQKYDFWWATNFIF